MMQWSQLSSNKLVACECSLKVLVHLPAMTSRLNFFRIGLQFLLRCSEWVSLQMTSTHLWQRPKNAKKQQL